MIKYNFNKKRGKLNKKDYRISDDIYSFGLNGGEYLINSNNTGYLQGYNRKRSVASRLIAALEDVQ
jgi:hypothetical protein